MNVNSLSTHSAGGMILFLTRLNQITTSFNGIAGLFYPRKGTINEWDKKVVVIFLFNF